MLVLCERDTVCIVQGDFRIRPANTRHNRCGIITKSFIEPKMCRIVQSCPDLASGCPEIQELSSGCPGIHVLALSLFPRKYAFPFCYGFYYFELDIMIS